MIAAGLAIEFDEDEVAFAAAVLRRRPSRTSPRPRETLTIS
jgi:hypothetical protein